MKYRRPLAALSIFLFLTLISQVGGLLVLIHYGAFHLIKRRIKLTLKKKHIYILSVSLFYLLGIMWLIPAIAAPFGREPLPWKSDNIEASNLSTIILFRNYSVVGAQGILNEISQNTRALSQNQGIKLVYLDANFPFFDGFPLLPHLSHDDRKKIDLAFLYSRNGEYQAAQLPNLIGYGRFEPPQKGEIDQPDICLDKGFWQYSSLSFITRRWRTNIQADSYLNACLGISICSSQHIKRVFLEPHLVNRWKIKSAKMKFHGFHAVRHDDHFHIEIR
ncbi:MAG: hypothetical protein ACI9RU_001392 [Litorivivens sp.]|jgi:hypothetical protein